MGVAIAYFLIDCAAPLAGNIREAKGEQDSMLSGFVSRHRAGRASGNCLDFIVGDSGAVSGGGQTDEVRMPRALLLSGTSE